ncbi:6-phosphogluconate dehydrogenase, decarboxylating [Trichonephila clavipes]|nr:6-phosphogluconate dehydrogenase, decarboxylating [Trichonephila clavipes]
MSFVRRPGSERPRQTSRREYRLIVRNARVQPTASSAAIQAQTAVEWSQVVFSDESRFNLSIDDNLVHMWRPRGERLNPAFALQRYTSPTAGAIFQQDNVRPHVVRVSQDCLRTVTTLLWPVGSPDMSPIEHIWDHLGCSETVLLQVTPNLKNNSKDKNVNEKPDKDIVVEELISIIDSSIKEFSIIFCRLTGVSGNLEKFSRILPLRIRMSANEGKADIALIGLAVMGQNLILNMNDHGFVVCAYNRTVEKVEKFLANEAKGTKVIGAKSIEEMVAKLKKPKRIMLLVKAGDAVDAFIKQLVPLLEPGDIIIDGGNSEYTDSTRRCKTLKEKGLLFVGSGVSGGEDGARYGPSLMPGGAIEAWPHIKNIFQSISAKVDGEPCCDWVGDEGSGHFVKMVHNGIEYGDMQLICEAYHLLKDALGLEHDEMGQVCDYKYYLLANVYLENFLYKP